MPARTERRTARGGGMRKASASEPVSAPAPMPPSSTASPCASSWPNSERATIGISATYAKPNRLATATMMRSSSTTPCVRT